LSGKPAGRFDEPSEIARDDARVEQREAASPRSFVDDPGRFAGRIGTGTSQASP
jgi:hypothetical protein